MFSQRPSMDSPPFIVNKNPVKLQHLCRMCATPCDKSVPIFGPVGEENELASKFNNYLPLKVSQTDPIPLQLCYECTNLLIQWDAAILVAVAADKKLRALLWREQQTQQINSQNSIATEESEVQKKRKRELSGVQESLSCSVCNSSGMNFRELVDHLKTHEETERSSRLQNSGEKEDSEDDCTIDDLLTPVVCLETFESEKEHSPINKDSKLKSPQIKKTRRGRPKGSRSFHKLVSELDDPIVTSSTSTPRQKSVETIEIDNNHSTPHIIKTNINANFSTNAATSASRKELSPDNQNNTFKPKVRIISAESINQTLEERAKANQTARNLESHPPNILVCSPSSEGPLSARSPTKLPLRRIVLSGQVVNGMNFNVPKPGQKFLKLADGRLIKIIQNNSSVPAGQTMQKVQLLSKVVPNSDKAASVLRPASPDAFKSTGSETASKPTRSLIKIDDLKKVVKVGDKQIRFTAQPGPKHCPNRYICALCGKRNLTEEMLHDHSQLHKDDQLPSN